LTAAIIVPTRCRAGYLRVTLDSVLPQARAAGVDVVVVVDDADAPDAAARAVAAAAGARVVSGPARGINAARNAGLAAAGEAEWLLLLDDDVEVHPGWLAALLTVAAAAPEDIGFLTGPVRARFEDHALRSCGRERPPVPTLDLGSEDTDAPVAWGVNLGVRRAVLELVGPFDERLAIYGGDEEELQQRWRAARPDGRIRYVAAAGVDHRRAGDDARLRSLARAARARGRAARCADVHRGAAPPLRAELRVLAGCLLHVPRYRCLNGIVLAAHTLGRIDEARRPTPAPTTAGVDDFLSGASGQVGGWRGRLARLHDAVLDLQVPRTSTAPPRGLRVLVAAVERPEVANTMAATLAELRRSESAEVTVRTTSAGAHGKFENLNALLAAEELDAFDWLLVVDDDVDLPSRFLDRFLAHATGAKLAQPAHRLHSHAAWPHTRRRAQSVVRPTTFVEIGPLTAFHRDTFGMLLPFPELRMGWGLDAHWAAVAREHAWPMVIVDATPIGHTLRPIAATYPREAALAEARVFLAERPYVTREEVR
jgi:GT2 family glycosyltransferase